MWHCVHVGKFLLIVEEHELVSESRYTRANTTLKIPSNHQFIVNLLFFADQRLQIVVHGSRDNETMDKIEEGSVVEVRNFPTLGFIFLLCSRFN